MTPAAQPEASIGPMCERDRHTICGGANCTCSCHPGTIEERATKAQQAITSWLQELDEVMTGTGRHQGHALRQVGRCVYCDCGYRYQGSLTDPAGRDAAGRHQP